MTLFALGAIDPLLVDRFSGFDRQGFVERVRLLSDGQPGPHEILQSSGVPGRTADITGTLQSQADVDLLRAYHLYVTGVTFTDGNSNDYNVRVLELSIEDRTDWWTYSATLYCIDDDVAEGS